MESMLAQEYVPGLVRQRSSSTASSALTGAWLLGSAAPAEDVSARLRHSTHHVTVPVEEVGDALEHLSRLLSGVGFRWHLQRRVQAGRAGRRAQDPGGERVAVVARPLRCDVRCQRAPVGHREARGLAVSHLAIYRTGARCVPGGRGSPRVSRPAAGERRQPVFVAQLLAWRCRRRVQQRDPLPGSCT